MQSMSDAAEGREYSSHDEHQVSTDADRLLTEHGEEADHVAARRADSLFREGDTTGGTRWLKIFRCIAMTHRRRTAE